MKYKLFLILGFLIFTSGTLSYADIPNEYSDLNHYSDITYNESANSITIQWDFTDDIIDDIIQSCHLLTNVVGGTNYGLMDKFSMFGLDFENERDHVYSLSYNLDSSEIDCKGEYTINIDDVVSYNGTKRYNFDFNFGVIINGINRDENPIDFFKEYDLTNGLAYTHALGYEYNEYGTYRNLSCSEEYGYFDRFMHKTVIIQDIEKDTKQSISYEDCIISSHIDDNNSNDGSCMGDCTPPTFGKNSRGIMLVADGFSLDENTVDVENWHVDYPMVTVNTNQTHNMKLKVLESTALKWIQVGFGIPEIGSPMSYAEVIALFRIGYDDILDDIEIFDKGNMIDITSVSLDTVPCVYVDSDCYLLNFDFTPREQMKDNVIKIDAVDVYGYSVTNYINDGMIVVGDSLNPPDTHSGIYHGNIYNLIETKEGKAVDEYGNMWSLEYDIWVKDYIKPSKIIDKSTNVLKRTHSSFDLVKEQQIQLALKEMKLICSSCVLEEHGMKLKNSENDEGIKWLNNYFKHVSKTTDD